MKLTARRRAARERGLAGSPSSSRPSDRSRSAPRMARRAPERRTHPAQRLPAARLGHAGRTIELAIPKLRQGSFMPSILEPRRRAEQAWSRSSREPTSTAARPRKVDRLVRAARPHGMKQGPGRRLCAAWNAQLPSFAERPLEGAYPYRWLDGNVERSRGRGVRQKCLAIRLRRPRDRADARSSASTSAVARPKRSGAIPALAAVARGLTASASASRRPRG